MDYAIKFAGEEINLISPERRGRIKSDLSAGHQHRGVKVFPYSENLAERLGEAGRGEGVGEVEGRVMGVI